MKQQWKGFVSGLLLATMVFGLGVPALAASVKQLNAAYSDIKITLDGKGITPTDANGNTVEPFAVDGTTYLPVRAVANALGLGVEWDGATQTVKLTSNPGDQSQSGNSAVANALVLTGQWKQVNSNSKDSWQSAIITADTIEVYWVSDGGETTSLYWAGTYVAPTVAEGPYTWTSVNDKEKTDVAMLASGDDTKVFTYKNGQLSYSVSALGTTTTVKLEKQ